jgi:hypothetical protein
MEAFSSQRRLSILDRRRRRLSSWPLDNIRATTDTRADTRHLIVRYAVCTPTYFRAGDVAALRLGCMQFCYVAHWCAFQLHGGQVDCREGRNHGLRHTQSPSILYNPHPDVRAAQFRSQSNPGV